MRVGRHTAQMAEATYAIRNAHSEELAALVEIERAAGEMFRPLGMDVVADDDPGSVEQLLPYVEGGRAFVAADETDGLSAICCSTWSMVPRMSSR